MIAAPTVKEDQCPSSCAARCSPARSCVWLRRSRLRRCSRGSRSPATSPPPRTGPSRGFDQDGNGTIDSTEGVDAASVAPFLLTGNRDGLRQTVIDLMQLVRVIQTNFVENVPLHGQPVLVDVVPGADAIQHNLDRAIWAQTLADPVAYARHIRADPLTRVDPKAIVVQFAKGDQTVPNPTTSALIRAGGLEDRAT
jgi:hypothetical protein